MNFKIFRFVFLLIFAPAAARISGNLYGQAAPPVPPEYQDLYGTLAVDMSRFAGSMGAAPRKSPGAALPAALLTGANCNLGSNLLGPAHYAATLRELDGLKALGARAVSMSVSFPILYAPFYASQAEYRNYLDFYVRLAGDIRARGLKLIVKSQVVFSDGSGFLNVRPYYDSLTLDQYKNGRVETVRTIAREMKPDYLSVIAEPDTEATQSGKAELGTLSGSTALLNAILAGLESAGLGSAPVGAGIGTWQASYLSYVRSYAATPVRFIDMHVYPVNRDYLARAAEIADTARSLGKNVAMSEAWLNKVRDSELDALVPPVIAARNPFSFWAPLDAYFIQMLLRFAEVKQLDFISFFHSQYFRAYVDYSDATRNLSPPEMTALTTAATADAMQAGAYTAAGLAYEGAIVTPADLTPPSVPVGLSTAVSGSGASLAWAPSSDNIGTAGYRVYRDGAVVASTSGTGFTETGLAEGKTYTYAVAAFDAPGNTSAPSASVYASIPDRTAPTVPAQVSARAASAREVRVSWMASADNVRVAGYRIYRGLSAGSLALVASTGGGTSFADTGVRPATAYYYAVAAVDAAGNVSAQSAPVRAATPASSQVR